ncbi:MAG: hypothetical protein ACOYXY_07685, partial [Thermodesulfobacteriota bacterium]
MNHESSRLRRTLRGFASETGSKSASLRNNLEGRLISPPIGVKINLAIESRYCYDAAMKTQDI